MIDTLSHIDYYTDWHVHSNVGVGVKKVTRRTTTTLNVGTQTVITSRQLGVYVILLVLCRPPPPSPNFEKPPGSISRPLLLLRLYFGTFPNVAAPPKRTDPLLSFYSCSPAPRPARHGHAAQIITLYFISFLPLSLLLKTCSRNYFIRFVFIAEAIVDSR